MRPKTTRVICNSHDPEHRPALCLSPLAVEDLTGEPQFTLTPAACAEMAGQTLLDAITAFDWRAGDLAKDFQAARDAYAAVQLDQDHESFQKAQDEFNKACRMIFFNLDTMVRTTWKA